MKEAEAAPGPRPTVVVAGFGPVGAAAAAALAVSLPATYKIVVLDAVSKPPLASLDQRMIAVSYGSRVLLERLGAWNGSDASPIRRIHVSQRKVFGRTLLKASDYGIDALGYVVPYASLTSILTGRVSALPVEVRQNARIDRCETAGSRIDMSLSDGSVLSADYVIHAEGQQDDTVPKRKRDYGQSALSAIVKASHPVADTAYERFTEEGPLALLPAKDGYALVWCAKPAETARRMMLSDAEILAELYNTFGERLGRFDRIGPRASIPLGLAVALSARGPREFSIGNAAQSLHPVAGQGFNLGLRDAFNASEAIATHFTDPELANRAFLKSRALDRKATIGMTDLLSRVFATPLWPLSAVRGNALAILDLIPALRHPLARQMMNGQR